MPKLAELLAYLFNKVLSRSGELVSASVAIRLVLVTKFVAIIGVGYATISGIISGLSFVVSPDLSRAMSWVVPDNFPACIGAVISAALARALIDMNTDVLKLLKG